MKKRMWIIIIACLGITGCAVKEDKVDTKEISFVEESSVETKEKESLGEDDTWGNFPFPYRGEAKYDEERKQFYYTLKEVLEDYDIMWQQLEENCAYLAVAEEELGIDLGEVKRKGKSYFSGGKLREGKTVTQELLKWGIEKSFEDLQNLGHISVLIPYTYEKVINSDMSEDDDLTKGFGKVRKNRQDLLRNEKSEAFYACLLKQYNGWNNVEKTENTEEKENMETQDIEIQSVNGIPYVKISNFSQEDLDIAILRNFFEENKEADNIIIDIRGNGGGSTWIWLQGIVSPLIDEMVSYEELWGVKSGKLNEYYWGGELPDNASAPLSKEEIREKFPDLNISEEGSMKYVMYRKMIYAAEKHCGFKGKLWLLVDEQVYSASDAFTSFCKNTKFATIIGKTTAGNGGGGEIQCIVLPNTGIVILYDAYMAFNSDGSCNGIHGEHPDIEIAEDEDALEVCLKAIAESEN